MGNATNLCAHSSALQGENNNRDVEKLFLDRNLTAQANKKALIKLLDEQYGHQLLPNVRQLQKYDRAKIEKVIYKSSTTETYRTKPQSPQKSSFLESKSPQSVQKVKENLHQFNQLQILKQKCTKIQLLQNELSRKKMPNKSQLKAQNEALQVQKQKDQSLPSKLDIADSSKK